MPNAQACSEFASLQFCGKRLAYGSESVGHIAMYLSRHLPTLLGPANELKARLP